MTSPSRVSPVKTLLVGATAGAAGLVTTACGAGHSVEGLNAQQVDALDAPLISACVDAKPGTPAVSPFKDVSEWQGNLAAAKASGTHGLSDKMEAALCEDAANAQSDGKALEGQLAQGGLSAAQRKSIEAQLRGDVFAEAVDQGVTAGNVIQASRAPAASLQQLVQTLAAQDGEQLGKSWRRLDQKTGQLEKVASGLDGLISDSTRAVLAQGLSDADAQALGVEAGAVNAEASLVPSEEQVKAQQQSLLGVVEDAKSASGKTEDRLAAEATAMYGKNVPDAVMSSVRASLEKGGDFNAVYKGVAKDYYSDPKALDAAVSDYMQGDIGTLVAQLTPGTAPDAECSAIVQRMLKMGATPAQIEAAVAAHVKTTFPYYVRHPLTIPHQPVMKWGLSPRTSDYLRVAGVTPEMVWQTIGDAGASAGTHAQDGVIDGHPYSAAFDLHVEHLSEAQIHSLLDRMAQLGIFGWFRDPGHDGWPSGELYHLHAVDANVRMKSSLRNQEWQYVRGENGLVNYGHDSFFQPTKSEIATVKKDFAKSNG